MIYRVLMDQLGANPVEVFTEESGLWALRFLWFTLLLRPLQRLLKRAWPARLRRMMGLYAYFYLCLHVLTFLWLEHFWVIADIVDDVIEHPYVLVGVLAFLLMTPLAVTSNRFSMRQLKVAWKRLHRLVYVIGLLGILHFIWLVKADLLEPAIYLVLLIGLYAWRFVTDLLGNKTARTRR